LACFTQGSSRSNCSRSKSNLKGDSQMTVVRLFLVFLITTFCNSFGSPMLYTFDGTVGESAWNTQFHVGDHVDFKFIVDFDRPAETWTGGSVEYSTAAIIGDDTYDYFYAKMVEGTVLSWNGTYTGPKSYGGNVRRTDGVITLSGLTSFTDDPYEDFVWIASEPCCNDVRDWVVGDHFSVDNEVHSKNERVYADGSSAWTYSAMTLTSIDPYTYPSVPEPSSLMLVASGIFPLVYLVRARKKNFKKKAEVNA